jgi:hypothetical protein
MLARFSLVREVHVHGLRGVAQYLVELEGFRAHHLLFLLPGSHFSLTP